MNNKIIKHRESTRNKGLFISVAAIFVLIILTTYKTPLFHNELNGKIMGFSEIDNKTELKLIATVRLDNGYQVLASMPLDLQKRNDAKATLIKELQCLGVKHISFFHTMSKRITSRSSVSSASRQLLLDNCSMHCSTIYHPWQYALPYFLTSM